MPPDAPAPTAVPAGGSGPWPLGVHVCRGGASAAVLAPHAERVAVALLSPDGRGGWREEAHDLVERTHGVWHGVVPGMHPGQRYGLRAYGPWDPARGLRYDPSKLLLDPWARGVEGELGMGPPVFSHAVDADLRPDGPAPATADDLPGLDSAAHVPHGVLLDAAPADRARRPRVPWADTVVYEAHVRGLTMAHPGVPEGLRGTYAALAHPTVVEHLLGLGVTALELLPVHAAASEVHLARRGATNYWGYNTLAFLAPEPRYATAAARAAGAHAVAAELAGAVAALHDAGLEVWLDVVYNHTCEGGRDGPTLSWRGLDASLYYRLDSHGRDVDTTGCGNSLDSGEPRVVQMWLDSLRHWALAYGIDGFRFDLATTLARGPLGFDPDHPFLVAARTDPALADVKLVAEPWDVGDGGWRTGSYPPPFAEWNDRFRDGVRTFWLADAAAARRGHGEPGHGVRELATRLAGSADLFTPTSSGEERGPHASVSYVTAHDGFTLADSTAFESKHNEANGEGNRDGHGDNRSFNHGVEGWDVDAATAAARRRSARNLLGTQLLATGVPMLTAGDETGRTQGGNNNAYCLDDPTTWLDWSWLDAAGDDGGAGTSAARDLRAVVAHLARLRREHPVLRQDRVFAGRPVHLDGTTDLAWFAADGTAMDHDRWHDPHQRTLQMFLHGDPVGSQSLLLVLHGGARPARVVLPDAPWARAWSLLWSSVDEAPGGTGRGAGEPVPAGGGADVPELSLHVFRAQR